MAKQRRHQLYIPLLNVLMKMDSEDRIIVMAHFDDATKDYLCEVISYVLHTNKIPFETRLALREKLIPYKKQLMTLSHRKKLSSKTKTRALSQIGGGPMPTLMETAIASLMNLFL